MKRVLIIAYLFPPIGGGGVQRTAKFVKYLPSFGWKPVILTGDPEKYSGSWGRNYDPDLLKDMPDEIEIHRTFSLDTLFKGKWGTVSHYGARLCFCPDDQFVSWLVFACKRGMEIMKRGPADVIYTTSVPFSDHFVGMFLKRMTGKPWVADFRDPWTTNPYYKAASILHRKGERCLESLIYRNADHIITSTEGYRNDLLEHFPCLAPGKATAITNGYDPDDCEGMLNGQYEDKSLLTISYLAGSSYGDDFLGPFLHGLRRLLDINPAASSGLKVELVGEDPKNVKLIEKLKIPDGIISFKPFIPQKDVARHLSRSDVLLTVLPEKFDRCIAQKTFLYLAVGKPVLAIVPEGDTARLIRSTNSGIVVNPSDIEGISESIQSLLERKKSDMLRQEIQKRAVQKYERKILAGELAQIFDAALVKKGES